MDYRFALFGSLYAKTDDDVRLTIGVPRSVGAFFDICCLILHLLYIFGFLHHLSLRVPCEPKRRGQTPGDMEVGGNPELDARLLPPSPSSASVASPNRQNYFTRACISKHWMEIWKHLTLPHYPKELFSWATMPAIVQENLDESRGPEGSKKRDPDKVNNLLYSNLRNLIKKNKHWWEHFGVFLQVFNLSCSILAFCLVICFWWNMLVEYVISCISKSSDGSYLGFLALFFIMHTISWFCKRFYQASVLFVCNTGDRYRTRVVVLWRFLNFFLCLLFTVITSTYSKILVTDTLFWQLLLRLMVMTGLVWGLLYIACVLICTFYTIYMLKFRQEHLKNVHFDQHDVGSKPLHWLDLLLVVQAHRDSPRYVAFKIFFVSATLLSGFLCLIIGWATDANFVVFVGISMISYYICIFGRRGKWNAVYFLWSGKQYYTYNDHIQSLYLSGQLKGDQRPYIKSEVTYTLPSWYFHSDTKKVESHPTISSVELLKGCRAHLKMFWNGMYTRLSNEETEHEIRTIDNEMGANDNRKVNINIKQNEEMKENIKREPGMEMTNYVKEENIDALQAEEEEEEKKELNSLIPAIDLEGNNILTCFGEDKKLYTIKIPWMEYWSFTRTSENDHLGFQVLLRGSCGCLSIIALFSLVIIFIVIASYFSDKRLQDGVNKPQDTASPYPVCQMKTAAGLNIMDFLFFSCSAYYWTPTQVRTQFMMWFGNETFESWWENSTLEVHDERPTYYHIKSKLPLELIVIRGTLERADYLQDISLYSEIAVLQMASYIIPLTTLLPVGFLRDFVYYAAIPDGIIDSQSRNYFDKPVYAYASEVEQQLNKTGEKRIIFLVGHSLGGGIAEIVGAKLADDGYDNVYSFGLSSPGTVYTSRKFDFSIQGLDKTSLSILPRRDPVSTVDLHGGLTSLIECDAPNTAACHTCVRSFCELYKSCGQNSVRNSTFADCVCGIDGQEPTQEWDGCAGLIPE